MATAITIAGTTWLRNHQLQAYEPTAGLVPCAIRPGDPDGADRLKVSSRTTCYRESSHQHRFSQAGLHSAGPSTWRLDKSGAAPDFSCTLASPSHQPSSCIAAPLSPPLSTVFLAISHRNLELLTPTCDDKAWLRIARSKRKEDPFVQTLCPSFPLPQGQP